MSTLAGSLSADTFVTGGTYVNATGDITFTLNDNSTFVVDLSAMDLNDTFTTASTLIGSTAYFNTTDALSAYTLDLSALDVNDTFVTGGTYSNATALITFTNNDAGTFTVDMSAMDQNDTFITGGTVVGTSGLIRHTRNDGTDIDVTGVTFTLTTSNGITADTGTVAIGGTVNIGLNPATTQKAVPTKDDKNLTPLTSTGNNFNTGISITNTPTNDGYVTVAVNGVNYIVGDGTTGATADCYFSGNGGSIARAIEDIVSGDELFWNGTAVGFNLDASDDHIDLLYDVLQ